MTLYISNRDGDGKTDEVGHFKPVSMILDGNTGISVNDMAVLPSTPAGMSVSVQPGHFMVDSTVSSVEFAYFGWNSGGGTTLTVAQSDAANPRIDTVILYVDRSAVTSPVPTNNPGISKFKIVSGAASAIPVGPTATELQSEAGVGNPYIILADVLVNAGVTQIFTADITDRRVPIAIAPNLVREASVADSSITSSKIAPGSVDNSKLASLAVSTDNVSNGAITTPKFRPTIINSNFTPAAMRFTTTAVGTFAIPNCSMTYTAGPTNETLLLWTEAMASKSTSGNGEIFLFVDGVAYGTSAYLDSNTPWYRMNFMNTLNVSAGQTVTLSIRATNVQATQLSVTNEVARWVPAIRGFSVYRP